LKKSFTQPWQSSANLECPVGVIVGGAVGSVDLEIHQERPCIPEAWNAWKKTCVLWCNVDTGALHESLEPWNVPSVSLRRSWPFHWDPPTGRLLLRTADGYNVHSPSPGAPSLSGFTLTWWGGLLHRKMETKNSQHPTGKTRPAKPDMNTQT
jgi:hypothetical protein